MDGLIVSGGYIAAGAALVAWDGRWLKRNACPTSTGVGEQDAKAQVMFGVLRSVFYLLSGAYVALSAPDPTTAYTYGGAFQTLIAKGGWLLVFMATAHVTTLLLLGYRPAEALSGVLGEQPRGAGGEVVP